MKSLRIGNVSVILALAGMTPSQRRPSESVSLDLANACLRRGAQTVPLRPKDLAVLELLVANQGRIVSKSALIDAAWPEVFVTEAVLKVCINRLRLALGDDARKPRFIETAHRRGYRLVGGIVLAEGPDERPAGPTLTMPGDGCFVGRDAELSRLRAWTAEAAQGTRRVVLVSGEAGVGKTSLIETFLRGTPPAARVARGQCIERYGAGEAYMPVLEALGRLCRGRGGRGVVGRLAKYAPSWLAQIPGVLTGSREATLKRRAAGVTRERMLREVADVVDVLAKDAPLILVIEDLHWSDTSTLDVLAALARRPERARLLVLGTYRPEDLLPRDHPLPALAADLRLHRLSAELRLPLLPEHAVQVYLHTRFPGSTWTTGLERAVHQRTDGHPLFLVAMADDWVASGRLVESDGRWEMRSAPQSVERAVPADVRHMIEARLDRLTLQERRLVEAASAAGLEFAAASVAAALGEDVAEVDERCAALARRQLLLRANGEEGWPDGTVTGRYSFVHALYRDVTYDQVPVARQADLHRRVARREEAAYGPAASRLAARLAMHFERAMETRSAVRYRFQAGRNAIGLSGYQEAIMHVTAGLKLLEAMPDDLERSEAELGLQLVLGAAVSTASGFAAAGAERAYGRAQELARRLRDSSGSAAAVVGLYAYHLIRGPIELAKEFAEQALEQGQASGVTTTVVWGHMARSVTVLHQGDTAAGRDGLLEALARYDLRDRDLYLEVHRLDPGLVSFAYLSWCLWILGYPEQALERSRAAARLADETTQPVDRAHALLLEAHLHQFRLDAPRARASADEVLQLCAEYGLGHWREPSRIIRGWARTDQGEIDEGIAEMTQGIEGWAAIGGQYAQPRHLTLLAEGLVKAGRTEGAAEALASAERIADAIGDRLCASEIHRVQGERLARLADRCGADARDRTQAEAREAFRRARAVARAQQAALLELRAATSLCRCEDAWGSPGARTARETLRTLYGRLTEGFDTRDLREARALLGPA